MSDDNGNKPNSWNTTPPVEINREDVKYKTKLAKISLNVPAYDDLVKQQGVRVKVFRTLLCPNVKSIDGGEHNINCSSCNNGFVDLDPICTWAFIKSQELDKDALPEGYYDANVVWATFLQEIELQYFTLVELPDYTDIFIERLKRQQGRVDRLKYRATKVHALVDGSGKRFYEGSDFSLDNNGDILWKIDRAPLKTTIYSVNYEAAVQFRAIKAAHVNRFGQDSITDKGKIKFAKINEQWLLQKEFLVERRDFQGNRLSPNLIRNPDED